MLCLLLLGTFVKISLSVTYNEMAAIIANQEFSYNYPTAVVWWEIDPENIYHFTEAYKGLVVTISLNNKEENVISTKGFVYEQTVLYVTTVEKFEQILTMINKVTLEPIHLILVLIEVDEHKISEFTHVAWEKDAAHIVIVTSNIKKEINLYTFVPYTDGDCDNTTPISVPKNASSFFIRKFLNFQKCPVILSAHTSIPHIEVEKENGTLTLRGFGSDLMELLVERLNATLVVISNEEHTQSDIANDSLNVGFRNLMSHAADMMSPPVFINEKRYSVALTSYTYNDLTIVWIAPKQREIYAWAKLILPFISQITPLIILSFLCFIIVIKVIQKFGRHRQLKSKGITFQSFIVFLGLEAKFETKSWLNNTTFVMWIWYCFIIRIAYQGDLINGLHKVILEPPIRTVADGLQNLDEVVGAAEIQELYKNTSLERYFKVMESNDLMIYIKKVVEGGRILLAEDYVTIRNDVKLGQVQFLEESVIRLPACHFIRARWPAADEFRRKIIAFHQNGFLLYIYYQYVAKYKRRFKEPRAIEVDQDSAKLTIATLSSSFYGLLFAYFICSIVFCLEIIWFKIQMKKIQCIKVKEI